MKKESTVALKTRYEEKMEDIPFSSYPRPQMRRDSYICLNGKWKFRITSPAGARYDGEINVPFAPESRISGVGASVSPGDTLLYSREFEINEDIFGKRVLLHIGACDSQCRVFVNGRAVCEQNDGYLSCDGDITDRLKPGKNIISVEARDPLDTDYPYGKQSKKRGGMWYTKTSGIWQTVWLEIVPEGYIEGIKITPDLRGCLITVLGGLEEKLLIFEGREYPFTGKSIRLDVENPEYWTPEDPKLYDFSIVSGTDRVESYFGLRSVECDGTRILLNGKPMFFSGLLDQGYFSDGIMLPASETGFLDDVTKMKKAGFNMLRKHIKLEPEIFYYYCDKYGMAVFQDMINSGRYSFFIDTALPTLFLKKGVRHSASPLRRAAFEKCALGLMDRLYNHPSVIYYTIFNEGWGQFDSGYYYRKFKEYDPTRIYDTASGWFKVEETDVDSDHVYFKPVKAKKPVKRPLVLSEFGGYACSIRGHRFNVKKTYGYTKYATREEFEEALYALYHREVIPAARAGLCASVLTQLSDVEDETNGLITYDRRVMKIDPEKMKKVNEELYTAYREGL